MSKAKPTRTTNPIHFEDLDPKRFEDLVRELIYDFREWQSIEATGKGGSDDGIDIRAFERTTQEIIADDDETEVVHPMDGNRWMIQCKREKQIGPTKLKTILEDVDANDPPYGYILVVPVNFSKKSYDVFRDELKARGVMEFYLWGKPELEMELHLPKNDRILFTFFGISYVTRRRSRATEIRAVVANKNKVMRAFGENPEGGKVLIRDSKDVNYPYEGRYPDFEERPRWKEFEVLEYHPLGLIVKVHKYFAYCDESDKTFDIAKSASLIFRESDNDEKGRKQREAIELVRDYWENLPRRNKAEYHKNGLIRYDRMLVVDDKGDTWAEFPHIFVDFMGERGPFDGFAEHMTIGQRDLFLDEYSEVERFPKEFPAPTFGTIHDAEPLAVSEQTGHSIATYSPTIDTLYDCDGALTHLAQRDVALVRVAGKEDAYIQITHRFETTVGELTEQRPDLTWQIERQIDRKPANDEVISVLEFRRAYEWQFKKQES